MNNKRIAASALAVALFAQPALAAPVVDDLAVSVTVEASCGVTTSPLNFGTIGTLTTTAMEGQGSVNVTCTSDAPYQVGLGLGANANVTQRRLQNDGATNEYLNYQLYRESGLSTVWGTELDEDTVSGTGNNAVQQITVYGSIPAGQAVSLGGYSDTVVASVWYGADLLP